MSANKESTFAALSSSSLELPISSELSSPTKPSTASNPTSSKNQYLYLECFIIMYHYDNHLYFLNTVMSSINEFYYSIAVPWRVNLSLSLSKLGQRVRETISNLAGSRKGEPIILTISPPESEEDSPQNTPSLTEMRAPNTSSPVGRGTPVLAQIPVSPISQLSGFSICESDYHDVSDESESDSE